MNLNSLTNLRGTENKTKKLYLNTLFKKNRFLPVFARIPEINSGVGHLLQIMNVRLFMTEILVVGAKFIY